VKDINAGATGSRPSTFFAAGNKLVFVADNGTNGSEPWVSDGSAPGTKLLQDVYSGAGSSSAQLFTTAGTNLFASMQNESNGWELWVANTAALLPLRLLEFNGKILNTDGVLSWNTSNEENTSHFEVERSIDGRNFSNIGKVQSTNIPGMHRYAFTDPNIVRLANPFIYYRLRMVDADGRFAYSKILALNLHSKDPVVLLYPNPTKNNASLMVSLQKQETLSIKVINQGGQVVNLHSMTLSAGSSTIPVQVQGLASGIYTISIRGTTFNKQLSLLKE
jgi:ELWxxDGT repeat protein